MNTMSTYELFQLLPAYLDVHHDGKIYKDCVPAIIGSGSSIMICYIHSKMTMLLCERINSEQELNELLKESADRLKGMTEYHPLKIFKNDNQRAKHE